MQESSTQLWWAGKEVLPEKKLMDYVGRNEKTKIVAKLQKKGQGPPAREPVFTEEDKKMMMAQAYKRQEELKVFFQTIQDQVGASVEHIPPLLTHPELGICGATSMLCMI
jgi:hypothetical protein